MRLFLLTALTMTAFAANSVLNRLGLVDGVMSPTTFSVIRVAAGAAMLSVILVVRDRGFATRVGGFAVSPQRTLGAAMLCLYMVGFSFAYLTLDAGLGALVLFGGVQITMFAGVLLRGGHVTPMRWLGAGIAFAGLVYLMMPGIDAAPDWLGVVYMLAAAVGWGVYSLNGQQETDALAATTGNFVLGLPIVLVVLMAFGSALGTGFALTWSGVTYAVISGAVTSGMGYALWYRVLSEIDASVAAIAQLTVPVIALVGGMMFLGEALTMRFVISAALVLGGVAISLRR